MSDAAKRKYTEEEIDEIAHQANKRLIDKRIALGLNPDGSRKDLSRSRDAFRREVSDLLGLKADLSGTAVPPKPKQQLIQFDEANKINRRYRDCRSTLLRKLVDDLKASDTHLIQASRLSLSVSLEATLRGTQKAIALGISEGFIECDESTIPQTIRLNPLLMLGVCRVNSSSPLLEPSGRTRVHPNKDLTSGRKSKPENDPSIGTDRASRARHDDDRICNGVMVRKPWRGRRASKEELRALLQDAEQRQDVFDAQRLLESEGVRFGVAEDLACCHTKAEVHGAIIRARAQRALANAGKADPIGYWPGYVVAAVAKTSLRPFLAALRASKRTN